MPAGPSSTLSSFRTKKMTDAPSADRRRHPLLWPRHDPRKPYLGDPLVVWRILTEMLDADPEQSVGAIAKASGILTGANDSYAPVAHWTSQEIGDWIRGHMNGVPDGDAYVAVEYALAHLVLHQWDLIKATQEHGLDEKTAGLRLRFLVTNWTHLMLGIPSVQPDADGVQGDYEHEDDDQDVEDE
jgi:hypothetical protein